VRHQSGIVDHNIDTPVCLHGCVDQSLDLVEPSDSVGMATALPPLAVSSPANDWRRLMRRAPSTTLAPCAERSRAAASPSLLLGARDDDFDVVLHNISPADSVLHHRIRERLVT